MKGKRFWAVVSLIVVIILGLGVTGESLSNLEQGKKLFFTARDAFYNRAAPRQKIIKQIEESKQYFSRLEDSAEKYCWLARANFLYSDVDKKQAEKWVRAWQQAAKQAVNYNQQSGQAYALLGSAHLLLVEHKNYVGKLIHSRKAVNLLQRSIKLDATNHLAHHSLGVYYLLAPSIVGGNLDKSIKLLKQGVTSEDKYIRCLGNFYLAYAYEQQGSLEQALVRVQNALAVYPNNPNIKRYRNVLQQKTDN